MLDTDTKRRIDTARNILVGRVPDPKSQVEQITIALIYKFMDDMDAEAEELGGKRTFFAGAYARYGWAKLMRSGLGGHETLSLYADAIAKMPENPGVPPLFREIFKNAFLPYRDPETLRAFLKIIDDFAYDHSERLGDAFEYLLSVLGSQGDAGQFRTPRHIIDFIVAILDPKKTDTILDPACGTAGFLISAWKHILKANIGKHGHSTLTPDERARLAAGIKGYDISPDMVRLSLVNLYLHGFNDPHIYDYDTLTSQDRWNEYADVILANPPFMSPKGGIRPHNRFGVQSKRSEVLFVDYMAEHLTPRGRAGIIVPEGIIFQGQTAYAQLRKLLVEDSLVAVVSLPAGVFNPYSGVKTSILILDRAVAKQSECIGFFKIDNDGFNLGAQRRQIDKDDLPKARVEIAEFLRRLRKGETLEDFAPTLGQMVAKEKIAATKDYNLSGERYREGIATTTKYKMVALREILEIQHGYPFKSNLFGEKTGFPIIRIRDIKPNRTTTKYIGEYDSSFIVNNGDLLIGMDGEFNSVIWNGGPALLNQRVCKLHTFRDCIKEYVAMFIPSKLKDIEETTYAVTVKHISGKQIAAIEIPLPQLDVQKEIVAEIEGYQKVIDGARAVLDNYRPHIPIHPDWPMTRLKGVCHKITDGTHRTPKYTDTGVPFLRVTDITQSNNTKKFISIEEHHELIKRCKPEIGDVLYSKNGTIGIAKIVDWGWDFSIFVSLALLKPKRDILDPRYLEVFLNSDGALLQATARSKSGTVTNLHLEEINEMKIPLPPLETQRAIVAEIEAERALVDANRDLIARMEKKIAATLARVWGEPPDSAPRPPQA